MERSYDLLLGIQPPAEPEWAERSPALTILSTPVFSGDSPSGQSQKQRARRPPDAVQWGQPPRQRTGQREGRVHLRCQQKTLSQPYFVLRGTHRSVRRKGKVHTQWRYSGGSAVSVRILAGNQNSEETATQAGSWEASQETASSKLNTNDCRTRS